LLSTSHGSGGVGPPLEMVEKTSPIENTLKADVVAGLAIEDIAAIKYEGRFHHGFVDGAVVEVLYRSHSVITAMGVATPGAHRDPQRM